MTHKLTPEQEARIVLALNCDLSLKKAEVALLKAITMQTEHLVQGTPLDAKTAADLVEKARNQLVTLTADLIVFRNVLEDRRTSSMKSQRKTQLHYSPGRAALSEHELEARFRDPRVILDRIAASIARRREEESKQ